MKDNILVRIIDRFSFITALIIQLVVISISMSLLSYQPVMKWGFVLIGWVVVLFAVRAYIKGRTVKNMALWAMFAMVSIFFGWSFALVGTEAQNTATSEAVTIDNDESLKTIRLQLTEARSDRDRLTNEYNGAGRAETVDSILMRQELNAQKIAELEKKESDRIDLIDSGVLTENKRNQASAITSDRIFSAIPDAIRSGRWFHLVIFGLIFIGLELTLVTAVDEQREDKSKMPVKKVKPKKIVEKIKPDAPKKTEVESHVTEKPNPDSSFFNGLTKTGVRNIVIMLVNHDGYPGNLLDSLTASKQFNELHDEGKKVYPYSVEQCQKVSKWIHANKLMGKPMEEIIKASDGFFK